MRALAPALLCLPLLAAAASAAEPAPQAVRSEIEQTLRPGGFAVVVQAGIPTTSVHGANGRRLNAHLSVDVRDGRWTPARGLLDGERQPLDTLQQGEIVEVRSLRYHEDRVDVLTVSVEAHKVDRGPFRKDQREPMSTNFKFFVPFPLATWDDVPRFLALVGAFLRPFPTEAEARRFAAQLLAGTPPAPAPPSAAPPPVTPTSPPAAPSPSPAAVTGPREVKPGMTMDEVRKLLGNPSREVTFGAKAKWTYPDVVVVFQDGRVSDVEM